MGASGALAGASALTLLASFTRARGERARGEATAGALETNARIAEIRAKQEEQRGQFAAAEEGRQTALLIGEQIVSGAVGGVDPDFGTLAELIEQSQETGVINQRNIRLEAWHIAGGLRLEAAGLRGRAALERTAGEARAARTLITGGLSVLRDVAAFAPTRTPKVKTAVPKGAFASKASAFNRRVPSNIQFAAGTGR